MANVSVNGWWWYVPSTPTLGRDRLGIVFFCLRQLSFDVRD